MTTIQTVTLSQLALSPLNVRQVKPNRIETLAEDIAAHGVIQSLGVYEEEGSYQVFAGGRRLRALQHQQSGVIEDSYAVPVILRTKAEAVELSAAENLGREAMHPADQVRAFAAMRSDGHTASEIAARFGYSTSHVARLLKLGSLSPSLLQAMAKDELSLDAAKALCLTDDHKAQREAFKACGDSAYAIRRYFSEDKLKTSDRLFRFVGAEAYKEAGGTLTTDLFAEEGEGYADHPELVEGLAHAKLDEIAEGLRDEGWHTVRVELDTPNDYYSLRTMFPTERELTEEEDERLAAIEDQLAKAEEAEDEDAWETLDALREDILDAARSFTDDQRQMGGVIVTVNYNGEVSLKHYHAVTPKREGEDEAKQPSLYSAKLESDMHSLRSLALQQAIAANGALALDILLDTLAASLLHGRWHSESPVGIEARPANVRVPDELHDKRLGDTEHSVAERFAALPAEGRFAAIQAMDEGEKMALLAGLVASTLSYSNPAEERFEQYADAAALDMRDLWGVNVPFCNRLTKKQMLTIMESECGPEAVANCKSLKKAEVAEQLANRLPDGWLPEPLELTAARGVSPSSLAAEEQSEVA